MPWVLIIDRTPRCRAEMARLLREVGYNVLTIELHTGTQALELDAAEFVVIRRELADFDDVSSAGDLEPDGTELVISWLPPSRVSLRRMTSQIAAANKHATKILEVITPALHYSDPVRLTSGLRRLQSKIWGKIS